MFVEFYIQVCFREFQDNIVFYFFVFFIVSNFVNFGDVDGQLCRLFSQKFLGILEFIFMENEIRLLFFGELVSCFSQERFYISFKEYGKSIFMLKFGLVILKMIIFGGNFQWQVTIGGFLQILSYSKFEFLFGGMSCWVVLIFFMVGGRKIEVDIYW